MTAFQSPGHHSRAPKLPTTLCPRVCWGMATAAPLASLRGKGRWTEPTWGQCLWGPLPAGTEALLGGQPTCHKVDGSTQGHIAPNQALGVVLAKPRQAGQNHHPGFSPHPPAAPTADVESIALAEMGLGEVLPPTQVRPASPDTSQLTSVLLLSGHVSQLCGNPEQGKSRAHLSRTLINSAGCFLHRCISLWSGSDPCSTCRQEALPIFQQRGTSLAH